MQERRKIIEEAKKLGVKITQRFLEFSEEFAEEKEKMVQLISERGIEDERVLFAMGILPRHIFVPKNLIDIAYSDRPLPIGDDETISQPFITAVMLSQLELKGDENVLEIGTGSGYMTALLCMLAGKVTTVEISERLHKLAKHRIVNLLGFENATFVLGDGSEGFPQNAPYHRISVSAAAPRIPPPLLEQLEKGGILIIPIGETHEQVLSKIIKAPNGKGIISKEICQCRFVKMKGKFGF